MFFDNNITLNISFNLTKVEKIFCTIYAEVGHVRSYCQQYSDGAVSVPGHMFLHALRFNEIYIFRDFK